MVFRQYDDQVDDDNSELNDEELDELERQEAEIRMWKSIHNQMSKKLEELEENKYSTPYNMQFDQKFTDPITK